MSASFTHSFSHADRRAAAARPSRLHRLRASVLGFFERRAVHDELSRLNDRELADIGLNRSEIGLVFDPAFGHAHGRRR